jgi:putative transposase
MARPIRIEYDGAFYHVTSRGNARQKIFLSDKDYPAFMEIFQEIIKRQGWIVPSYCLMGNHYHLLIETPRPNLSQGMRQLNGIYTQRFNRLHKRSGHIFQGRYKAFLVEKESYLLELSRYIVLNPVRAGMVKSPEEWEWSSYCLTAGIKNTKGTYNTDSLLSHFSKDRKRAQNAFIRFVKDGMGKESPLKEARGGILLGSDEFIMRWRSVLGNKNKEIPRQQRYAARPSLQEIFQDAQRDTGIGTAINDWGYRLKDIQEFLGLHYSRVSRIASQKAKSKT